MRVLAMVLNHWELKSGSYPQKKSMEPGCSERFAFISNSKKEVLKN